MSKDAHIILLEVLPELLRKSNYITIHLDKYYIIDHFNIFKGTYYPVLYSPYLQNYLSCLVVLGIILKLKKHSLMVNSRTEHPFCVLSHNIRR